jgi:PAS domain S-box-containing protein
MSLTVTNSLNIVIALNLFSLVVSVLLSAYALRLRPNRTAVSFAALMAIFALWSLLKLVLILNPTLPFLKVISVIIFTISSFTSSIILYIIIIHTRYPRWFRQEHVKYLFLIPVIQALLALTNEFHHLFIRDYVITDSGALAFFRYDPGPLNIIFPLYLYLTIGLSLFILLRNLFTGSKYFNMQVMFLFIGIALPALNDILFWFGVSFIPGYRLTPEFFIFGNIFFAWALFGYRFLDLKPIARNRVVESIDEIIIITNNRKLLTDINKSGEVFFGLKLNEVIGRPFSTVFEGFPELSSVLDNFLATTEISLDSNGTTNYFIVRQSSAEYSNDQPLAKILILQNITERKNAEIQLRKYADELEKANALKDQSFRIIANDIRNPFQGLIGYSDFVLNDFEKLEAEKVKHIVGLMNETSKKGYNLLENILEWSRVQTETLDFNPGFSSLTKIAGEAVAGKSELAADKNITITNHIVDDVEIFADSNMIYSVFRNLLSNAIKFNKIDGTITVSSSVNLEEQRVMVEIADTGIGIPEEVLGGVFLLKSQVAGIQAEQSQGLGLLLCREYIEKNGGTISIESRRGEGTSVFFSIPFLSGQESSGVENRLEPEEDEPDGHPPKYKLPEAQSQMILNGLISLLEKEKVFKNQNLTINEFSSRLNTNRTYLSQIINDTFHTNFSNLINDYRIKEAELQLANNNKKLTMEAIAFESGFSSKSAFYTAFRKKKGKTPTEFLNLPANS